MNVFFTVKNTVGTSLEIWSFRSFLKSRLGRRKNNKMFRNIVDITVHTFTLGMRNSRIKNSYFQVWRECFMYRNHWYSCNTIDFTTSLVSQVSGNTLNSLTVIKNKLSSNNLIFCCHVFGMKGKREYIFYYYTMVGEPGRVRSFRYAKNKRTPCVIKEQYQCLTQILW